MKPTSLIFLFSILYLNFFSTGNDSLIPFSSLDIKNEAEKNSLKAFQAKGNKADIIDLFLSHYTNKENFSSAKVHQLITDCVNDLKNETSGQDDVKKVKTIYKLVHKRFLNVYKLQNSFTNIFETGEYNCVSGSALYAIIFHLMDIPFQVVEAPQHVFLFAYPNSHRIAIETTMPQKGYFTFSDSYVQKFINYLHESKMISNEEFENTSPNQLFEKYYFETKGLSIQGLAAIQYANYAIYDLEENENEKALEEIKKAYFIHQSERTKYLLQSVLRLCITNNNYKTTGDVHNLAILCRMNAKNNKEVSNEQIKYEFSRLTQEQLVSNSDFDGYTKSFNTLSTSMIDSVLKSDISFHYHYEMARLGFTVSKENDYELMHLKGAYAAKPRHADLRSMIKSYFSRLSENDVDMSTVMKRIDTFSRDFDFLNEDHQFNTIRANCFLEMAYQRFMLQDISKGESYLANFESLCSKNENIKPGERFVERAYSTAAAYYYKKGNRVKTQQTLKKGIVYAPENFGLQMRLSRAK